MDNRKTTKLVDEASVAELFRKARPSVPGPSPYLKTRVLAHLREQKSTVHVFKWKWFSILSASASVAMIALFLYTQNGGDFTAKSGQPVLVKVELQNIQNSQVAFAEIVLPEGVHFHSGKFPEVNQKRSLTLAWDDSFAQGMLPFVVKADSPGAQKIKILLKDQNDVVIGEKVVQIRFKG